MSVVVLVGLVAAACAADDMTDDGAVGAMTAPPSASTGVAATETASSDLVTTSAMPAVDPTADPSDAPSTAPSTVAIEPVPDVRVPGIDSANPFCRAWSVFAGSFQTLAFASIAESDPVAAARLEVVASAAVTSAAQTLADEFPESVAAEREVFLDDVIGPFARRAARAIDELRAAGLAAGDIEQLGDVWLAALVDAGVDDPEIVVVAPGGLTDPVDAATEVFAANVPVIAADPGLVTEAQAPATLGYLADNCPDRGILAGNDAID